MPILEAVIGEPHVRSICFVAADHVCLGPMGNPKLQTWPAEHEARVEADRTAHDEEAP